MAGSGTPDRCAIGYSDGVYGIPLCLAVAFLATGCASSPQAPVRAPAEETAPLPAPAVPARVSACVATPSTVYGDEPVVFDVMGEGSVELEVIDARQQVVHRTTSALPTQLRLADLASGDFSLRSPSATVTCQVTVNRELSRATEPPR